MKDADSTAFKGIFSGGFYPDTIFTTEGATEEQLQNTAVDRSSDTSNESSRPVEYESAVVGHNVEQVKC